MSFGCRIVIPPHRMTPRIPKIAFGSVFFARLPLGFPDFYCTRSCAKRICRWKGDVSVMIFLFEDFELDTEKLHLKKSGEVRKVEPQVFDLLQLLVRNRDRVVTKDEINKKIWGGRIVSDAVVNSRIRTLRHAVNDNGAGQRLVKTFHKRGFRFIGDVEEVNFPAESVKQDQTLKNGAPTEMTQSSQPETASRNRHSFAGMATAGSAAVFAIIVLMLMWISVGMGDDKAGADDNGDTRQTQGIPF